MREAPFSSRAIGDARIVRFTFVTIPLPIRNMNHSACARINSWRVPSSGFATGLLGTWQTRAPRAGPSNDISADCSLAGAGDVALAPLVHLSHGVLPSRLELAHCRRSTS